MPISLNIPTIAGHLPDALPPSPVMGLAGGVGSGKSTIARKLAELGAVVIDSDALNHAVLAEADVVQSVRDRFGDGVMASSCGRPGIDRRALAKRVFGEGDEADRQWLEGLTHPRVRARREALTQQAKQADASLIVIDTPLLFETGVASECDVRAFIDAPLAERIARVEVSRGWDEGELHRREKLQWPLDRKRGGCHISVNNASSAAASEAHLSQLIQAIQKAVTRP